MKRNNQNACLFSSSHITRYPYYVTKLIINKTFVLFINRVIEMLMRRRNIENKVPKKTSVDDQNKCK
jgi:hypothetical protein